MTAAVLAATIGGPAAKANAIAKLDATFPILRPRLRAKVNEPILALRR